MRFLLFFAVGFALVPSSWSQEGPVLADRMFCHYVGDFAPQIARNRIRKVPFLRIDEFDYFNQPRRQFLRQTAQEIYAQEAGTLEQSLDSLAEIYIEECRNVFESN